MSAPNPTIVHFDEVSYAGKGVTPDVQAALLSTAQAAGSYDLVPSHTHLPLLPLTGEQLGTYQALRTAIIARAEAYLRDQCSNAEKMTVLDVTVENGEVVIRYEQTGHAGFHDVDDWKVSEADFLAVVVAPPTYSIPSKLGMGKADFMRHSAKLLGLEYVDLRLSPDAE